jgi:transcriptional regulator with XRE-family HTH domain
LNAVSINIEPGGRALLAPVTRPAKKFLNTFGKRLRFARTHSKLTQAQLARGISSLTHAQTTKALVSQWETDRIKSPAPASVLAVTAITGFAQEWLIFGKGDIRAQLPKLRIEANETAARSLLRRALVAVLTERPEAAADLIADAAITCFETLLDEPDAPDAALRRIARQSIRN